MRLNKTIDKLSGINLWLLFFLYTCCISAIVQMVLLPYFFSNLYAGNGLFISSFDSLGFHKLAVDLSDKIRTQGWSAWQLKPEGHAIAGIISIFYALLLPDPRILIPINAVLHASAVLILVNTFSLFIKNKSKAVLCALPFLVFPSNLQWTAQLHRDGYSILGMILLLYGMASPFRLENFKVRNLLFNNFRSFIYCTCGLFLIWFARSYMLMIIVPFTRSVFFLLFLITLVAAFKKNILWRDLLLVSLPILLMFFVLAQMCPHDFKKSTSVVNPVIVNPVTVNPVTVNPSVKNTVEVINKDDIENYWKRLPWFPTAIDCKIYKLAQARRGFRLSSPEANSNIDRDVGFGSIRDALVYLPRAAQIAFLAPFPNQWLHKGSSPANSLMRRVSAYEMIVVYFSLLFLPYAIWYWRKRIEMWIISSFCVYMMLVYGLVVCNIGTLYRMRYVYITTLAALGIAGFITFLENLKINKRQM